MRCGSRAQAGRVASARPSRRAACRSSWGSSPPIGDTSRISDDRAPLLQAFRGQANGEPAVEPPGPPLGAGELGDRGSSDHFEAVAHAGQQPVELVVAQLDLAGQELADTGLANAAEARQCGLGGARFAHHLAEQVTASRHAIIIASYAIDLGIRAKPQRITAAARPGGNATSYQTRDRAAVGVAAGRFTALRLHAGDQQGQAGGYTYFVMSATVKPCAWMCL
jgi:hypothetical protein